MSNGKRRYRINHLLSRLPSFHAHYRAFESIIAGYEAEAIDAARGGALHQGDYTALCEVKAWAEEIYVLKLRTVSSVDRQDGIHLAEFAVKQANRRSLREYVSIALERLEQRALTSSGIEN